jgi:cell division septation protein DedD
MESKTKQYIFGATILSVLLAVCIPLWFSSHHQTTTIITSDPPEAPDMPVINLKIPPLPAEPASFELPKKIDKVQALPTHMPHSGSSVKVGSLQSSWRLKLGNFSNENNSLRLIQLLKDDGFEAYRETMKEPNGQTVYQVFIGPSVSELEALELQKHLIEHLGLQSMILAYPSNTH